MISRRSLETATATLTGAFGAAVAFSSLDNGVAWSRAGVESGTFPFITGLIILGGSLWNLVLGWLQDHDIAIDRHRLRLVGALFVPAAIYVGFIPLAGMYVASALYMLGMLAIQSKVSVLRSVVIALATALTLYLVFERMFQVSLPAGLLGSALGF